MQLKLLMLMLELPAAMEQESAMVELLDPRGILPAMRPLSSMLRV